MIKSIKKFNDIIIIILLGKNGGNMKKTILLSSTFLALLVATGCSTNTNSTNNSDESKPKVEQKESKKSKIDAATKRYSVDTREFLIKTGLYSANDFENTIVFKDNRFVWKYGYAMDDNTGINAIIKGKYRQEGTKITLYDIESSKFYQGSYEQLSNSEYTFASDSSVIPSKLVFKLSDDSKLSLKTKSKYFGTDNLIALSGVGYESDFDKISSNNLISEYNKRFEKTDEVENSSSTTGSVKNVGTPEDPDINDGWIERDKVDNDINQYFQGTHGFVVYLSNYGYITGASKYRVHAGDQLPDGQKYYIIVDDNGNKIGHINTIVSATINLDVPDFDEHHVIFGKDRKFYVGKDTKHMKYNHFMTKAYSDIQTDSKNKANNEN